MARCCILRVVGRTRSAATRGLCSSASTELPSSAVGQLIADGSVQPRQGLAGSVASRRQNRLSVKFTVGDTPGGLEEVLALFRKHNVNLTRLDTRPSKSNIFGTNIFVDHEGAPEEKNIVDLYAALNATCQDVIALNPKTVPWFPRAIEDLDLLAVETLDAGEDLESDHPGFNDEVYRQRRTDIVRIAQGYKYSSGGEIERLTYTADEIKTWGVVYDKLHGLLPRYGCKQYNYILPLLERNCGYAPNNIPQLADISIFLKECTGFQLRPVAGLLSARDFLNALAFRVFFSTQYIRHHATPLYTPEPDVCHELLGHAPMFADPNFAGEFIFIFDIMTEYSSILMSFYLITLLLTNFADFSHEIGLASLGASDSDIERLASCYWHSVEFGLCKEGDEVKAYGAGLLSSFGELEYSCSPARPAGGTMERPKLLPWDPLVAASTTYPITTCVQSSCVRERAGGSGGALLRPETPPLSHVQGARSGRTVVLSHVPSAPFIHIHT